MAGLAAGAVATGVAVSTGGFAAGLLVVVVDVVSAGLAGAGVGVGVDSGFVLGGAAGDSAGLDSELEVARRGVVEDVLSSPGKPTSLAVALAAIRGTFSFTGEAESSSGGGASPEGSVGGGALLKLRAISSNVRPLVSGTRK